MRLATQEPPRRLDKQCLLIEEFGTYLGMRKNMFSLPYKLVGKKECTKKEECAWPRAIHPTKCTSGSR